MKLLIALLTVSISLFCQAEETCDFQKKELELLSPQSTEVANSFWQQEIDSYETIDRLFINYKDGSIAVVEHKHCSMYNFEVAYYSASKNDFLNLTHLKETLNRLVDLSAVTDGATHKALDAMIKNLETEGFRPDKKAESFWDGSTDRHQRAEYGMSYLPLDDSSLHKAALFFYMGIGGED